MNGAQIWRGLRVADRERRDAVRSAGLTGLASIDVEWDGAEPVLRLVFIGRTPEDLRPANVVLIAPSGTPHLRALSVQHIRGNESSTEHVTVRLSHQGGPGIYRLRLADTDTSGSPLP